MKQAQSESDKREKRALERKLSEMEEELRVNNIIYFVYQFLNARIHILSFQYHNFNGKSPVKIVRLLHLAIVKDYD